MRWPRSARIVAVALAPWALVAAAVAAPYYPPRATPEFSAQTGEHAGSAASNLAAPPIEFPEVPALGSAPWAPRGLTAGIEVGQALSRPEGLSGFSPPTSGDLGASLGFAVSGPRLPPGLQTRAFEYAPADTATEEVTIPEPASLILLVTGLAGLWARGRLRKRTNAIAKRS